MHIAIDDTYSSNIETNSMYVTNGRRTHVAICFDDSDVEYIREQMKGCLVEINENSKVNADEFHFVDIWNKKGGWKNLDKKMRLPLFEFFAKIYRDNKWRVFIQTVDSRTLSDHPSLVNIGDFTNEFDTNQKEDLSLLLLLLKIRIHYKQSIPNINLIIDEGRGAPGEPFGYSLFKDWPGGFNGVFASSREEPLLQLADFICYCVNRSTVLATKENRKEEENQFLEMVASMGINSEDFKLGVFSKKSSVEAFDKVHLKDRKEKGLE